ncbi:MAG: glycine betaine/L-proline ABC transporter ATP-binding protein ProV [Deltaproteobacteria bacterium]|nr:glycine betaine/L-proline ABC transporter ATP-binding protein ProV [Deltaproteobacteria bacterium]MBT4268520.1 glycine betaine/L-proline ABC transporter ATP-binding protein ProV [Deltaproteobacteria bacterium]MBT4641872.1 glycine betaine/L-proline ABC transporter ATP-binding protein ProV [Deltaproteobacteria bacterium]MBT6503362.1 glycine betaine/L-proline ABC transporter ATP-binding protein ProV [Deltaproteobacteria bacterium]MBT6613231.1 glycine betaine/L-proline ABC transporter ATP-bindin
MAYMTEEIIRVENLYKIFGHSPQEAMKMLDKGMDKEEIFKETGMTVGVQDANFSVRTGEIFVVMGLSGSGKSTLVRMLNRLIEITSGAVFVNGRNVADLNQKELTELRRTQMSMVFQSFALMPHLSVIDNAAFGLALAKVEKTKQQERAMEALEQVGLGAWADSFPHELSGGMQQRVGLARALAVDPQIMLMDEAFSALDPLIRTEMQDQLLSLQEKHKRTIVFISHDLDEAMRIGDRIAIMEGGRIVQVGTPDEILQNPANDYVQAFFRGVDPTSILVAGDIARETQITVIKFPGKGPRAALQRLISHDREFGYVLDKSKRFLGVVSTDSLKEMITNNTKIDDFSDAFLENVTPVNADDSMQDILDEVVTRPWPVPVLNEEKQYVGVISKNIFLRTLQQNTTN